MKMVNKIRNPMNAQRDQFKISPCIVNTIHKMRKVMARAAEMPVDIPLTISPANSVRIFLMFDKHSYNG